MFEDMFKEEKVERKFDVEDKVMRYQNKFNNSLAEDTHSPSTYLIEDDLKDKLDSLLHQLNIENGQNKSNVKNFKMNRRLLKGFKYKFINAALSHFLDIYEKEEGEIHPIECITYKVNEYINNKIYIIKESEDSYTLVYHGHDAVEIDRVSGVPFSYVEEEVRNVSDRQVRIGRKKGVRN